MLRVLFLALGLAGFSIGALAQAQPDKKEPGKPKKISLDKAKLPKDAILVLIEDILDASQIYPRSVVLPFAEYQEMREKLKAYERQLKSDKKTPFRCTLSDGKLDDLGHLVFRAEFGFSTELPKTNVVLGLQGGHLLERPDLDGSEAFVDFTDEGFVARVEKEGDHLLSVKFRVPVFTKKAAAGSIERGINLELPGAAVTIVDVQLPIMVKELRWNETLEKTKTPGRFVFGMEKAKTLALAWKEPAPIQGNTPLAKVDGQINVTVQDTDVNINAYLLLEDIRPQTKEWQLLLPGQAKITDVRLLTDKDIKPGAEFKSLVGVSHPFTSPQPGTAVWKIGDLSPGKWLVSITQRTPRPPVGARVLIGPFHVLGAFQHSGTITVQMPTTVSYGQRLIYVRNNDTFQLKSGDTDATFQYSSPAVGGVKGAQATKAPLELEWRNDKSHIETRVEHALKLKSIPHGTEVEATTRIQASALSLFNALELKLPTPRPRGMSLLGVAPMHGFPAGLPWAGIWKNFGAPWTLSAPEDITVVDENGTPLKVAPQDATGKVRVISERPPAKQMTIVLKNTFKLPVQQQHIHVELPRPLNSQDRGARVTLQADERMELLFGPEGAEEPVPERQRFEYPLDQAPSTVDVAWRPFEREVVADATLDVTLFEHSALVRQKVAFPKSRTPAAQVVFRLPRSVPRVNKVEGADSVNQDPTNLYLKPKDERGDKIELVLEYDLPIKKVGAARTLEIAALWPGHVSQKNVKVRVWCPAGVRARLPDEVAARDVWKERSIELVKDKDAFPALVLQAYGASVPLTLRIEESAAAPVAAFLADRALIQIRTGDDESQQVQARYWVRKIHASHIDVELPLPPALLRDLHFTIGKHTVVAEKKANAERIVRVPLHPEQVALPALLEIRYTVPADGMERNSFWRTTLHAPSFRSDVLIGQMRWQFSAPTPLLAAALNRKTRPDNHWVVRHWMLTPEPSMTNGALEAWLTGSDAALPEETVTYAFWLSSNQPETIYHLPRAWWLLGCSGLLIVVTLSIYFSPLPRAAYWVFLMLLAFGLVALEATCPAALPPILFGLQPGMLVLVLVVGLYWILQERYRRQLVFLPGFTRAKPASTVLRSTAAKKRSHETSTQDAPLPEPEPSEPKAP